MPCEFCPHDGNESECVSCASERLDEREGQEQYDDWNEGRYFRRGIAIGVLCVCSVFTLAAIACGLTFLFR